MSSLRVAAAQQALLRRQQQALARQAKAIVALEERIARLMRHADTDNPAQDVPEPAPGAPAATSDEALGDLNEADVTQEGAVTESERASVTDADVTSVESVPSVEHPGVNEPDDVTTPVAGTTEQRPLEETKTESDVKVNEKALGETDTLFDEDNLGPAMTTAANDNGPRLIASMRLARARVAAGIADTDDDLMLGQQINASKMSDDAIRTEIDTLEKVKATASKGRTASRTPERARGLVPKRADGQREAASFAAPPPAPRTAASTPSNDEFLFE